MKVDPSTIADILHDVLNVIWERKVTPDEWNQGLLIKVSKKGNLATVEIGEVYMLLSVSSKVVTRIILVRLKTELDAKLRIE